MNETKWPEKNDLKEARELECDSHELNQMIGWNACHEAFMAVIEQNYCNCNHSKEIGALIPVDEFNPLVCALCHKKIVIDQQPKTERKLDEQKLYLLMKRLGEEMFRKTYYEPSFKELATAIITAYTNGDLFESNKD